MPSYLPGRRWNYFTHAVRFSFFLDWLYIGQRILELVLWRIKNGNVHNACWVTFPWEWLCFWHTIHWTWWRFLGNWERRKHLIFTFLSKIILILERFWYRISWKTLIFPHFLAIGNLENAWTLTLNQPWKGCASHPPAFKECSAKVWSISRILLRFTQNLMQIFCLNFSVIVI